MKKHLANKLFYDKYLYKLEIHNSLSPIFRNKNFPYAREVLDKIQLNLEESGSLHFYLGRLLRNVNSSDFKEAQFLLAEFQAEENYTLRVECPSLNVYSNNKLWLEKIATSISNVISLWEPVNLNIQPNVIVTEYQKPYEYKITVGSRVDEAFATWADKNKDKVWVGPVLKECIRNNQYTDGMYFYLRDERVLHLLSIMIGNSIKRVDKIVCNDNIDK